MVGFSLDDILGRPVDTAETREIRFKIAFGLMLAAVGDLRFVDARQHLAEMGAEIDDLDAIVNGTDNREASDP